MENNIIKIYHCEVCNRDYSSNSCLKKHYESQLHIKNLERSELLSDDFDTQKFFINLKNKNGENVNKTIVDKETYKHICDKKYPVHLTGDGYAQVSVNRKLIRLHQYIYYVLFENVKTGPTMVIDHKNGDRMDNRIDNLREVSISDNNKNKAKKENATSKYYGVYYHNKKQTWNCTLKHESKVYSFVYDDELHAAYHYDILVKKFGLEEFNKLNNVKKPKNFVKKDSFAKKDDLPRGICRSGNRFIYSFKNKHSQSYDTPEEAIEALNIKIENHKKEQLQLIKSQPIKRNSDGLAIIQLFNKDKECVGETIVDEEDYYNLKQYPWFISKNYVTGYMGRKNVRLARYVMNCVDPTKVVDHIDGNRFNNQKHNLRILTIAENNQNKSSKKGSSSKYTGIYFNKRDEKWIAGYRLNNKLTVIGKFDTELEAAKARENVIIKLNAEKGTYYKLNFPEQNE